MRQYVQLSTFLLVTVLASVTSQVPSNFNWLFSVGDPCVNNTVLTQAGWRNLSNTAIFFNDFSSIWTGVGGLLPGGWFRFDNSTSGVLATSCPPHRSCGSYHPAYLAGPLPQPHQGIGNMTVYVNPWPAPGACGTAVGSIPVKNCNGFYAYGLIAFQYLNASIITAASPIWTGWISYCIDNNATACPAGTHSHAGAGTACEPLLPNVTQAADIIPVLPLRALEFRCTTNTTGNVVMSQNQTLEVEWLSSKFGLLHAETVILSQNINVFHLNSTHNWIRPYGNVGQKISCRVRVSETNMTGAIAYSPWESSSQFYAGIEVSNSTVRIQSNTSTTIYFRSTVPVSPWASEKIYVSIPKYQNRKVWQVCGDKSLLMIEDTSCGIEITSANPWIPLLIHAKDVQPFAGLQLTKIHLRTNVSALNTFFSNSSVLDISVTVIPPPSPFTTRATCTMRADPHVKTFDSYYYDHQMAGEYIIARDTANDIQINGFFQATTGRWFSLCGIAVRSAGDVFVYSKCITTKLSASVPNGPPTVVVETRGCNIGGISYSEGDRFFEVRVPNGMVIKGINRYRNYRHFDLEITAKEPSYGSLQGLCGTFDGTQGNDLLHSDLQTRSNLSSYYFSPHLSFSQSWSVNATNSLFNDNTSFNTTHKTPIFCSCSDPNSPTVVGETECGAAHAKQTCEYTSNLHDVTDQLYLRCSVSQSAFGRRKRAADMHRRYDDNQEVLRVKRQASSPTTPSGSVLSSDYDNEAFGVPFVDPTWTFHAPQWRNGWNETKAKTLCSSKLNQTRMSVAASVPGINITTYLEQCVFDIKISGTNAFVDPLLDTIIEDARNAMMYDTSLWSVTNGVLQPDFTVLIQLCPDDCSGNGACVEGSCVCSGEYFGESCARSTQDPPEVTGVAWGGLCDSSLRPCQAVAVFGDNFIYNSSAAACLIQEFEMNEHGTIMSTHAAVSTAIDVMTRYKAYCEIPATNRGKRSSHTSVVVHGYNITVTNNGTYYSTGVTVLVADSRCLECNVTSTTCSIKNNTCLINKQCYLHNETDSANTCLECDPTTNQLNFTLNASACFIGSQCFSSGHNSSSNLYCDPAVAQYNWTPRKAITAFTNLLTEEDSSFMSKHWWIVVVLGLIAAVVFIGLVLRFKKSGEKKVVESTKKTGDTYRSTSPDNHHSLEAHRSTPCESHISLNATEPSSPANRNKKPTGNARMSASSIKPKTATAGRSASSGTHSFSNANKSASSAKHEIDDTYAPSTRAKHSPAQHDVALTTSQTWKSWRTNNAFGEIEEPAPADTHTSTSSIKPKSVEANRQPSSGPQSVLETNIPSSSTKQEMKDNHAPSSHTESSPVQPDVAPSTSQTWTSCRTSNAFGEIEKPGPPDVKDEEFDLGRMTPNPTRYQKADKNVLMQIVGSLFARRK